MTRAAHSVAVVMLLASALVTAGCSQPPPAKSPAPAKVANPQKEADLTTITLTPEAERRLGIETVVLAETPVQAERTSGARCWCRPDEACLSRLPWRGVSITSKACGLRPASASASSKWFCVSHPCQRLPGISA